MYDFCFYFFLLFTFSVLGWIVECVFCTIDDKKLTLDRGFLIGPYLPIYGYGTLFMYLFLNIYSKDPIILFFVAMLGASFLEYVTSYVMEKLFKARWWDYTGKKFNLNGRICLRNTLCFGVIGLVFTYLIKPKYVEIVDKIPHDTLIIISLICFVIFVTDTIVTFFLMSRIKSKLSNIRKDSTSDIDKEVRKIIMQYLFSVRRLFKSFPNIKFSLPKGEDVFSSLNKALSNLDELRKERKKRIKNIKKIINKDK